MPNYFFLHDEIKIILQMHIIKKKKKNIFDASTNNLKINNFLDCDIHKFMMQNLLLSFNLHFTSFPPLNKNFINKTNIRNVARGKVRKKNNMVIKKYMQLLLFQKNIFLFNFYCCLQGKIIPSQDFFVGLV